MSQSNISSLRHLAALALLLSIIFGGWAAPKPTSAAPAVLPPNMQIFGSDVRAHNGMGAALPQSDIDTQIARAGDAHLTRARYHIHWSELTDADGVGLNGTAVMQLRHNLWNMISKGIEPILNVLDAPAALQYPPGDPGGKRCWAPTPENLSKLTDFVRALDSTLYSSIVGTPSITISYWQFWNEPENCMTGQEYVNLLKAGRDGLFGQRHMYYVIISGLILECPTGSTNCSSGAFLSDVLKAGGASYFNIVDYHSYAQWGSQRSDWSQGAGTDYRWGTLGGILLGKARFIRSVLSSYGVSKPILVGEAGLKCNTAVCTPSNTTFFGTATSPGDQANYLVRTYIRAASEGLIGVNWYAMARGTYPDKDGLYTSDLLNDDAQLTERNAYKALKFLTSAPIELQNATYAGNLSSTLVEGYRFCKGAQEYRVYWTNSDSRVVNLAWPTGTALYNVLGGGHSTQATFEPLIASIPLSGQCAPQQSATWMNDLTSSSYNPPAKFSTTSWISGPGGACDGLLSDTCHLDTRAVRVEPDGHVLVSITANGKYWTYDQTASTFVGSPSGATLISVGRWAAANGPCANRPYFCQFDTRSILNENGQNIEYITAYGKWYKFNLATGAADPGNGTLLTAIPRYRDGPCVGQTGDACTFDSATIWASSALMESVTAYGKRWDINLSLDNNNIKALGNLETILRYSDAAIPGPCVGWPAGFCQFRTRTVRYDASNHLIETITN